LQQWTTRTAGLLQQRAQQVHGLYKIVIPTQRERLSISQSALQLIGQFIHSHNVFPYLITSVEGASIP
jgi:hypothetical protein